MTVFSDKIQQDISEELSLTEGKGFHEDEFVMDICSTIAGGMLGIPPEMLMKAWQEEPEYQSAVRGTLISIATQLLLGVQLIDRQEEEGEDRA